MLIRTSVNMGGTAEPGFVPWGQGFFVGRKTRGGCMFQEVDPRQSFPELEQEIMPWWDQHNIVQKALRYGDRRQPFVFFEGPPTANGRPGVHHIEARVVKDIVSRYHHMCGQYIIGSPQAALEITDGSDVTLQPEGIDLVAVLAEYEAPIRAETLATSLRLASPVQGASTTTVDLERGSVTIGISRS